MPEMMRLHVKNWHEFQHYKDRAPPWIKLHKGLLDNYEYQRLPVASRALAPMLWLLASESEDGSIEYDCDKIAFRLRTSCKDVADAIDPLIKAGFMVVSGVASNSLAEREQDAMPEKEVEEEAELEEEERQSKVRTSRGHRLPGDAALTELWVAEAKAIRPDLEQQALGAIFAEFRDYWIAQPGQKGTKTDWIATWRNWVRREKGFKPSLATRPLNGRQAAISSYAAQAAAARGDGHGFATAPERDITSEAVRVA
jgi:hypothetical protein